LTSMSGSMKQPNWYYIPIKQGNLQLLWAQDAYIHHDTRQTRWQLYCHGTKEVKGTKSSSKCTRWSWTKCTVVHILIRSPKFLERLNNVRLWDMRGLRASHNLRLLLHCIYCHVGNMYLEYVVTTVQ
jgi:hypothetical protein